MSKIKDGSPGDIPAVPVKVLNDEWENMIRTYGVVNACEWFGHAPNSEFTAATIKTLRNRSYNAMLLARGEA